MLKDNSLAKRKNKKKEIKSKEILLNPAKILTENSNLSCNNNIARIFAKKTNFSSQMSKNLG